MTQPIKKDNLLDAIASAWHVPYKVGYIIHQDSGRPILFDKPAFLKLFEEDLKMKYPEDPLNIHNISDYIKCNILMVKLDENGKYKMIDYSIIDDSYAYIVVTKNNELISEMRNGAIVTIFKANDFIHEKFL